jgi:hypothetical protein
MYLLNLYFIFCKAKDHSINIQKLFNFSSIPPLRHIETLLHRRWPDPWLALLTQWALDDRRQRNDKHPSLSGQGIQ